MNVRVGEGVRYGGLAVEMEEKEVKESGSGLRRAFIVDSLTPALCSRKSFPSCSAASGSSQNWC